MLQSFLQFFKDYHLLYPHNHFLVAVSGGMDSVVLCSLCKEARLAFSMAHGNFQLRGGESDRDEAFVKELAIAYGVPLFVKRFDTALLAEQKKLSVQETARSLRYEWFEALRQEHGMACVLLAHHANDNIETVLMNYFRGTGLEGLTGIPLFTPYARCARPLLSFKKKELEQYAREKELRWVDDSSNSSVKYSRNFFRHEVIPAIQKIYPQAEDNLLDNIERFKKTKALYNSLVEEAVKKLSINDGNEIRIPVFKLAKYQHTSLIYELIKPYGFTEKQVEQVMHLLGAASGKYVENERHQIIRHRKWIIIVPRKGAASTYLIDENMKAVSYPDGRLMLGKRTIKQLKVSSNAYTAQLDIKEVHYPLLLRKWRAGDYFYPLGMKKKKKLSRFFIDLKLSKVEKEATWVVESNKRIAWVVGYRIDERFKVNENTREVLQLTVTTP